MPWNGMNAAASSCSRPSDVVRASPQLGRWSLQYRDHALGAKIDHVGIGQFHFCETRFIRRYAGSGIFTVTHCNGRLG